MRLSNPVSVLTLGVALTAGIKVGGWLGHRVATALTPDVGPGSGK